ncbi:tetratricopeptide repeat protein [Sedimenticola hydrogenitrophicus]|uniref:tetratricopeptide repeat protein n=1 Tax=Sedimenticola hydrogenitrophicus TaxID=2967975 RepID=UPI0021A3E78E|nr:hypothetical protein [Sedimenticola hydrogenitrophicus]
MILLLGSFMTVADSLAEPKSGGLNESELVAISTAFAQAINDQDMETLSRLIDMRAFGERAARTLFDRESDIQGFVKGFSSRGSLRFVRSAFGQALDAKSRAKYLRILRDADEATPLVRVDIPSGGHEYILLTVEKNTLGEVVVSDLFLATTGKQLSISLGAAAQLLIAPSDTMIRKLFNVKSVDRELLIQFREIGKLRREKRYLDAYRLIQGMPLEIRTQRVILDLAIQLSQAVDDQEYYHQLELLAKHHGDDPSTAFMLIDYYFSRGDMTRANDSIGRMIVRFGNDAALMNLKASIAYSAGNMDEATAHALESIRLENDFEDGYWTLVTIHIATEQYTQVVDDLKRIEQTLGYEFRAENFANEEFYAGFVKSRAFSDWLN